MSHISFEHELQCCLLHYARLAVFKGQDIPNIIISVIKVVFYTVKVAKFYKHELFRQRK